MSHPEIHNGPEHHPVKESGKLDSVRIWILDALESIVFSTRFMLIPFYACLLVALGSYAVAIIKEAIILGQNVFGEHRPEETLLQVLGIVDIVMIANLIVMILIGSYSIFVRKMKIESSKKPQWLDHITSGNLKVKMGMSVVGVSTIHLLKNFVEPSTMSVHDLIVKSSIHSLFIVGTFIGALTNSKVETH